MLKKNNVEKDYLFGYDASIKESFLELLNIDSKIGYKDSCECRDCRGACMHKPGWFMPGEVEKVANYLDLTILNVKKTIN